VTLKTDVIEESARRTRNVSHESNVFRGKE
jgi:hypothetical protein